MDAGALVAFSHATSWERSLRIAERYFEEDVARRPLRIKQRWSANGKGGTDIGFGASVYPAAIVLSAYISNNASLFVGKRVIELGAGCGLVSIAAAAAGAQLTVATDGDPGCVSLARENAALVLQTLCVVKSFIGKREPSSQRRWSISRF